MKTEAEVLEAIQIMEERVEERLRGSSILDFAIYPSLKAVLSILKWVADVEHDDPYPIDCHVAEKRQKDIASRN